MRIFSTPDRMQWISYVVLCQSKWLLREDFQISLIAISRQWWSGIFFPSCLYQSRWNENRAVCSLKLERNQIWVLKNQLNILEPVHVWFVQSSNCFIKSHLVVFLVIIQNWTYQKVWLNAHKIIFLNVIV